MPVPRLCDVLPVNRWGMAGRKFWLALFPGLLHCASYGCSPAEVLREMRKLDREWIGWSYLSMAPDIFLLSSISPLPPFFPFVSFDTSCRSLSLILVIRMQFRIFSPWNSPLPAYVERRVLEKWSFFLHSYALLCLCKIRANDGAPANCYKPEQFVRATAICIIPYIFYSVWWITCAAR